MSTLNVNSIQSGYGKKQVINNVSFELKEGEFCALLGLNGCGKSTLIKTLCGLISVKKGGCLIEEKQIWNLNEKERAKLVSYIPQRGSTIYGKSILDVVLMGFNSQMGLFENYNNNHRTIAESALIKVGCTISPSSMYEEISEGQKQLVILARTIVQNTPVVLMDEPDSALDFTNKNRILKTIKQIVNTEKKAGLIALQDPNVALSYCDRLLIMKEGTIIHDIARSDFNNSSLLNAALSDIYGNIKIIYSDGVPVMIHDVEACHE